MFVPVESVYAKLAAWLGPPRCACKLPRVTVCVAAGQPCESRQQTGDCDCSMALPRPCKHALAKLFELPWLADEDDAAEAQRKIERLLAAFATLYAKLHPKEFPPAPAPAELFTPAERMTAYMRRANKRRRQQVVSRRDRTTFASLDYTGKVAGNGRIVDYHIVREQGVAGVCRACRSAEPLTDGYCGDCTRARSRNA